MNEDLEEEVYMTGPLGILERGMIGFSYDLKQVSRQWNFKFSTELIEHGFIQSKTYYSLFTRHGNFKLNLQNTPLIYKM